MTSALCRLSFLLIAAICGGFGFFIVGASLEATGLFASAGVPLALAGALAYVAGAR